MQKKKTNEKRRPHDNLLLIGSDSEGRVWWSRERKRVWWRCADQSTASESVAKNSFIGYEIVHKEMEEENRDRGEVNMECVHPSTLQQKSPCKTPLGPIDANHTNAQFNSSAGSVTLPLPLRDHLVHL